MDTWGSGKYGAKRGNHWHKGTDYVVTPGASIIAPIDGKILREAKPYANTEYNGCVLVGKNMTLKMFYFTPFATKLGQQVKQGDTIGRAQDIAKKYGPDMKPHIHVEIIHMNADLFINEL